MAQFSTNADFSTDAANTVADDSNVSTITGWTWQWATGGDWAGTITADAGAEGGKYVAFDQDQSGSAQTLLSMDGPGSIATQTETDVLFRFRIGVLDDTNVGRVRAGTTSDTYYTLRIFSSGDARLQRWTGTSAQAHVGGLVAKGIAAGTWYWCRINVTSAGSWSWRVWSGAVGDEPGTFDVTGASSTTRQEGFVGVGTVDFGATPADFDWFSVGTAGDSAPSPGGGGAATGRGRLVGGKLVGGNLVGVH